MKKILLIILLFSLTGCANTVDLTAASDVSATALSNKYNQASEVKSKYQLIGTALKTIPKADPKDRIVVTVGSDEVLLGGAGEFEPSVKISRWDEVSMKLTPKGLDKIASKNKKVSFEGNKIKYETPKVDYKMYDLPANKELEEGGYEYEVILKEKPVSNVVEFDIETQGLDFFYQPPLNEIFKIGDDNGRIVSVDENWALDKDGEMVAYRPENVVGSYEVFASENKTNWEGGKKYKIGKVGHIYRPKIVDSVGTEIWGQLSIDKEKGILTVTIPQEFLNRAVYPVRHAAGLTFGYTGEGGSVYSYGNNYAAIALGTPADGNGNVSKISAYAKKFTKAVTGKAVIWLASSGEVITNGVGGTVYINDTTLSWRDMTYSTQPAVTNGINYYVGVVMNGSGGSWAWTSGSAGTGGYDSGNNYTTPETLSISGNTTKNSIYATYAAAAPVVAPAPSQQIIIFD